MVHRRVKQLLAHFPEARRAATHTTTYQAADLQDVPRQRPSNIVLLGPPGSGKSVVAKALSRSLRRPCIDVDEDWLEKVWGKSVAAKLAELGDEEFLKAEGEALMTLQCRNTIVSLTGSVPLHQDALKHVAGDGILIYLDVEPSEIVARCHRMKLDRIIGQQTMSLEEILRRRRHVYEASYDHRVIVARGDDVETVAHKVLSALQRHQAFVSTRGYGLPSVTSGVASEAGDENDFVAVVRRGLAPDRGLYLPPDLLPLTLGEWSRLVQLPYSERALCLLERFPLGRLHPSRLRALVASTYTAEAFGSDAVLPVSQLEGNQYLMEMYHGPTASFKDLSLQLMPKLLAHANALHAKQTGHSERTVVLVATSGDTGTAAMEGFGAPGAGFPIIVLYPKDGVSVVQRAQMQTAQSKSGLLVLGVESDFDFCQAAVKTIFNDAKLQERWRTLLPGLSLSSANSINWGRLLPQVAYSASAYLDLVKSGAIQLGLPVDVCIPTGNFGNFLAAFLARKLWSIWPTLRASQHLDVSLLCLFSQLGVPIRRLICASNANNVLFDFLTTGTYDLRRRALQKTASPSIDILVSSNLERFLFIIAYAETLSATQAAKQTRQLFEQLEKEQRFSLPAPLLDRIKAENIVADWCSEDDCLATIGEVLAKTGRLIDPHTAVAKCVADRHADPSVPMLIASTAHFSKFPDTILKALGTAVPSREPGEADNAFLSRLLSEVAAVAAGAQNTIHRRVATLTTASPNSHSHTVAASLPAIIERIDEFLCEVASKLSSRA